MDTLAKTRQRRRIILTCVECRKRKQKCDRGQPCVQCIARGPDCICKYEKFRSPYIASHTSPKSNDLALSTNSSETRSQPHNRENLEPELLRHAHDYGYSNSDSLTSMAMLTKVISGIDAEIPRFLPAAPQIRGRIRAEYYGYVRRLPSKTHCEILFQFFFDIVNKINSALDETIFREQLGRWWELAYKILSREGPENLPADLQLFPALIYQILAFAVNFLPEAHATRLEELKFSPLQTLGELSREYSDCGVALSNLLRELRPTLVSVQQSFLRDLWLTNTGDILQAWNHSGQTVKAAMAIGLHLEPEVPASSKPEELLDALWMNQQRKRIWLNLFVWDNYMAMALGRPMFIEIKNCTVSEPLDCDIPVDRLKRVPVGRSESEEPTPMTERLARYTITRRFCEIRELESQGPIPLNPEKVKELNDFGIKFRKELPSFYQFMDPDTRWDEVCPFVPTHRYMTAYLVESFLMAVHRPYIFTRPKSQRQVYESALTILDSQDRFFEVARNSPTRHHIALTFPTFDAAVLLAVVLVSNPERYHASFSRPYHSLKRAIERLRLIGSVLPLARIGSEILETTIRRVLESHERSGPISANSAMPSAFAPSQQSRSPMDHNPYSTLVDDPKRVSQSPDVEPWLFEVNHADMDWAAQNPDFFESLDFSNMEVPMPLKELFYDEEIAETQVGFDPYDSKFWISENEPIGQVAPGDQQMMDGGDNSLWNFLAGYSGSGDNMNG